MLKLFRILLIILPIAYGVYVSWIKEDYPVIFPAEKVAITGYIDDYPEERISSNRYRLRIEKLNNTKVTETARILIVTSPYTKLSYGEEISLYGTIEMPEDFITDTGKTFDYDSYLKLSKVYGITRDPDIEKTSNFKGSRFINFLYKIRHKFSKNLDYRLPKTDASLSQGVLLGEKVGLNNNLRENLARTSTSHIIALSGYNITIVSEIIMKALNGVPIIGRTLVGAGGIIIFIALAGGGSSALRAGIMAGILLYARARGKTYNAVFALALAISILTALNPLALRYDMGFHLSILATFGLIAFQNPIAIFLIKKRLPKFFAEIAASTLAATIMTLPYIAYNMGIISVVGILANIIVVPLVPALMLFSFLTGIIPGILSILTVPFVFITHVISKIMLQTIDKLGSPSWAAIYVQHIYLILILAIYTAIFYAAFKALQKES